MHRESLGGQHLLDQFINFAYWHGGELFTIVVGIWLTLYGCFARRMTFEGDVAVKPEDRVFYKPTRKMRLSVATMGVLIVFWGLWGSVTRHVLGHGIDFVVRHEKELTGLVAGIAIFSYVVYADRHFNFKSHPKVRIYLLAFGAFSLCYSLYACIRRH